MGTHPTSNQYAAMSTTLPSHQTTIQWWIIYKVNYTCHHVIFLHLLIPYIITSTPHHFCTTTGSCSWIAQQVETSQSQSYYQCKTPGSKEQQKVGFEAFLEYIEHRAEVPPKDRLFQRCPTGTNVNNLHQTANLQCVQVHVHRVTGWL